MAGKKKTKTMRMVAVVREGGTARVVTAEVPLTTRLKLDEGPAKDLPVALRRAQQELEKMAGLR